ncbi:MULTISPECIES: hypothetical protein [Burkholderia cepacia complex]|nr:MULTISPECIES: hypothetical protein [Burkholderia cepacia complex]MBR7919688.1 hypothetical protein [Burkholderia vietnamiensis]MBR8205338.1 hypothetical protein [Burkholderia vietnamiensis]
MNEWTNQAGQPITSEMTAAAQAAAQEQGEAVSDEAVRAVLDVGLPYSMRSVPKAAEAAGIAEWLADLMLDAAIAAI